MASFALLDIDRRYMVDSDGNVYGPKGPLKPQVGSHGYLQVALGRGRIRTVHRLVAEAFIPNPEEKPQVAHYDGDRLNAQVDNLYWATKEENAADQRRHGTNRAKLSTEAVAHIRATPRYRGYQAALAERYGVHKTLISKVIRGAAWKV